MPVRPRVGRRRRAGGRPACTRGRSGRRGRASTGTSRQARTRRPSSAAISSMRASAARALVGVVGQEGHADGVGARRRAGRQSSDVAEERVRDLGEDAGTVTDQRVGAGGAAVVEVAQGGRARASTMSWPARAAHRGDEGHTAGVVLVLAAVQAGVGGLGGEAGDGHVASPSSGSSAAEDRARQGQARTALATSGKDIAGPSTSCYLSRAIPHPGTLARSYRVGRSRRARRPVNQKIQSAQQEHDDARPDVEPLAEDVLGLVGAHRLDDDPPDRVAGDVERRAAGRGASERRLSTTSSTVRQAPRGRRPRRGRSGGRCRAPPGCPPRRRRPGRRTGPTRGSAGPTAGSSGRRRARC